MTTVCARKYSNNCKGFTRQTHRKPSITRSEQEQWVDYRTVEWYILGR